MSNRRVKKISSSTSVKRRQHLINDMPEDLKQMLPELINSVFDGYHTTGKLDDKSFKKKYNRIVDMPDVVKKLINIVSTHNNVPKNTLPIVTAYFFTRGSKIIIDAPDVNCPMRLLLNFNHRETFYLDPTYESINEKQEKVIYMSGLDDEFVLVSANSVFLIAPQPLYTIRDMNDNKIPTDKKRSANKKPRPSHYERINVTIDYIVPEQLMERIHKLQKEVGGSITSKKQSMKEVNEQIRKLGKEAADKNPELRKINDILSGKDTIDGNLLSEIAGITNSEPKLRSESEDTGPPQINEPEINKPETNEPEINESENLVSEINSIIHDESDIINEELYDILNGSDSSEEIK